MLFDICHQASFKFYINMNGYGKEVFIGLELSALARKEDNSQYFIEFKQIKIRNIVSLNQ